MPHGDVFPGSASLREPFADPVVQAQAPLLHQHDDRGSGKLLSQGARLVHRTVAGGYPKLHVCQAIPAPEHNAVIPHHGYGNPGDVLPAHLGGDVLVYGIQSSLLSREGAAGRHQQGNEELSRQGLRPLLPGPPVGGGRTTWETCPTAGG